MSVKGGVYAITGAASGIGAATARTLARKGAAALILGDLDLDNLQKVASECEISFLPFPSEWASKTHIHHLSSQAKPWK
jgi:NADP-dependent 3-hydroxy acid dehydrogenase YdfG